MDDVLTRREAWKAWSVRAVTKGVPAKEVMLTDAAFLAGYDAAIGSVGALKDALQKMCCPFEDPHCENSAKARELVWGQSD